MKVKELIEHLSQFDGEKKVCILENYEYLHDQFTVLRSVFRHNYGEVSEAGGDLKVSDKNEDGTVSEDLVVILI